ncbi:MAG: DUF5676 family membrane protein [Methanobacteriota archaeon]
MVRTIPLANAVTIVGLVAYAACAAISLLIPGALVYVAGTWAHTLDLTVVERTEALSGTDLAVGFVTWGLFVWAIAAASASLYNRMGARSEVKARATTGARTH